MLFDPNKTILAGVPTATLRQWLAAAQNAYADLMTGRKPVTVSYDGKSVTYKPAEAISLADWIVTLQRQLAPDQADLDELMASAPRPPLPLAPETKRKSLASMLAR